MTVPANRDASTFEPSSAPSGEASLVHRIRAGDGAAFEALFREHWSGLYRCAFRYLRSPDEAEEAVQLVFARVWRAHAQWRVVGSVHDYLHVAVRNACFDRLKQDSLARKWRDRRVGELRAADPGAPEADRLLRSAEIEAAIERSLAQLPAKRREICELRFAGDLSYAEIAARLGVTTKTVETQIARGLKFLRERLRESLL